MTGYEAARKAFIKCRSRISAKNRAVSTFLARQYLIETRSPLDCLPEVERLLDEWYAAKANSPTFVPPVEPEATSGQPVELEPEATSGSEAE